MNTDDDLSYKLWLAGHHDQLLSQNNPEFLGWIANYGLFDGEEWRKQFLLLGRLKRLMWERVGRKPFGWAPIVELRMPWGWHCLLCIL